MAGPDLLLCVADGLAIIGQPGGQFISAAFGAAGRLQPEIASAGENIVTSTSITARILELPIIDMTDSAGKGHGVP